MLWKRKQPEPNEALQQLLLMPSASSLDRKARTEQCLQELGFQINPHLPAIEEESDSNIRSASELSQRLICLWAVSGHARFPDETYFKEYLQANGFWEASSPDEKQFLGKSESDINEGEIIRFSWCSENMYLLAWCGGLFDSLQFPSSQSSLKAIFDLFPAEMDDVGRLEKAVHIQSKTKLLNCSDFLYRLHWAMREPPQKGQAMANAGVILEWHKAINWMTCYSEEDNWDEVTTDT